MVDTFWNNCLPGPVSESACCFGLLSKFNHSCNPNAMFLWRHSEGRSGTSNSSSGKGMPTSSCVASTFDDLLHDESKASRGGQTTSTAAEPRMIKQDYVEQLVPPLGEIVSIRPIRDGDEVCICYVNYTISFEERQAELLDGWGFLCDCEFCCATRSPLAPLTDQARWQMQEKRKRLAEMWEDLVFNESVINISERHPGSVRTPKVEIKGEGNVRNAAHAEETESNPAGARNKISEEDEAADSVGRGPAGAMACRTQEGVDLDAEKDGREETGTLSQSRESDLVDRGRSLHARSYSYSWQNEFVECLSCLIQLHEEHPHLLFLDPYRHQKYLNLGVELTYSQPLPFQMNTTSTMKTLLKQLEAILLEHTRCPAETSASRSSCHLENFSTESIESDYFQEYS
ncbi:unnamed protein product, partial [Amoebophrya sp. A25]|eukprot:GSA25T00000235001.1